jgi:signal transduction histidine kinase
MTDERWNDVRHPATGSQQLAPPARASTALLSSARASITFATILFFTTLAQVLVSPIAAYLDGRGNWTLPLSFSAVVAALTLGCLLQGASLAISPKAPRLAVVGSVTAYFALLFVVQAPSWLGAMHLVIALALFLLAARSTITTSVIWTVAVALAGTAGMWIWATSTGSPPSAVIGFVLGEATRFVLLAFGGAALGIWWRVLATKTERARHAAEAAQREHDERIAKATESERARIAQELHDVAGQHLAGLITLADAALRIAPQNPEDALQLVEDVRNEGRFAAASLSGALFDLRAVDSESVEVTRDLQKLSDLVEYWRKRGMKIEWHSEGALHDLPAVVSTTAYRAAAEALTNAAKHAPGAEVKVNVVLEPEALHVSVINGVPDSAARPVPGISLGWGLAGLRDRIELLRGTMAATAMDGGWRVEIRMPVAAGES